MPQQNVDAEIRALQIVIDALEPLDDDARSRVLDYTLRRLGMREISGASSLAGPPHERSSQAEPLSSRPREIADIRSLRNEKEPSSAIEMAALVAYYLAEAAPSDERRDEVTTADIEKYFKQANYRLPARLGMTLPNAAAAGYFDRVGRGEFRLNPVGFNLVTQSLPRGPGDKPRRTPAAKRATQKAPAKNTDK
jgi:hypothetical protein